MDKKQRAVLKNLLDKVAGEATHDPQIEISYNITDNVDRRAKIFKDIAEKYGIDPEIVDTFDLVGIEAEDITQFLREALRKLEPEEGSFPNPEIGL